jgi:polyisoprenoid-binding protein YceI
VKPLSESNSQRIMEAGDRFIGIGLYLCISECRSDHPLEVKGSSQLGSHATQTYCWDVVDRLRDSEAYVGAWCPQHTVLGGRASNSQTIEFQPQNRLPKEEQVNAKVQSFMRSTSTTLLIAVSLWLCAPVAASAQQVQVTLDPAQSKIEWTLDATMHTVHGAFKLKSASVSFDAKTGNAGGEIVVDATSAKSGNQGRDNKMHKDVLESKRYPEITFFPKHITGALSEQGTSTLHMQGVLHIHGADHEITWPIQVKRTGNSLQGSTKLVVPYEAWGMKNPSNLFLHVSDKVEISIDGVGRVTSAATASPSH